MNTKLAMLTAATLLLSLNLAWSQSGRKATAQQNLETVELKGEVTNVLMPLAKFTSENKEYTVHLGPVWFWKQENLKLEKGPAEIVGEIEERDGERHLYASNISQKENNIVLKSDEGTPKWANQKSCKGKKSKPVRKGCSNNHCCRK